MHEYQQTKHLLSSILPTTICKILSNSVIIINIWWSRRDSSFFTVGMSMATIFSFVFGYFLISSLNIGLTYEISRKRRDMQLIGVFYQRTLLVNFLFCVFVITPILYLSKNIVKMFKSVDYIKTQYAYEQIGQTLGKYLYQLVPSIYAFAFYDTTQSFLLAQGHILAPLVIQVFAIVSHMTLIHYIGPAWSKNMIDLISSILVYMYIITLRQPLESWIEWTIKCIKGWKNYLKFLQIICFTAYLQGLFFFFFCVLGYQLETDELSCHICYINIYLILYLLYIGIKQGALIKIGFHIKKNQYEQYKTQGIRSIKLFVCISILFLAFIFVYQKQVCDFFFEKQSYSQVFKSHFYLFVATVFIDSFQMGLSSLLKALNKNYSVLSIFLIILGSNIIFYTLSLALCYYLCYSRQWGMKGLWVGWIIGLAINSLVSLLLLFPVRKRVYLIEQQEKEKQKQSSEDIFISI